jgi:AhpD family alkylhydroperoxidase
MKLNDKIKELIAVGASITANCQPCLEYHAAKALEAGADAEEIAEAIGTGKLVRKGAGTKMDRFAATLGTAATACCSRPAGDSKTGCCS